MTKENIARIRHRENPATLRKLLRIRDRTRPLIPHLRSDGPSANCLYANIDKIRLDIKKAYLLQFENQDTVNLFLGCLKLSKIFIRNSKSRIFTTRKNKHLGEKWLFNVELKIIKDLSTAGNTYIASLSLSLNPTRFLNHFISNSGYVDPQQLFSQIASAEPEDALEKNLHLGAKQFSLDGDTNLLPEECYRGARPATLTFDLYLSKVLSIIELELNHAMIKASRNKRLNNVTAILEDWYIPHLEIYWEFYVANSISFVKKFHDEYMPILAETELTHFRLEKEAIMHPEARIGSYLLKNMAPSSKLNLGSNLDLVTYSKKIDRVRFELRFKKNVRAHLGLASSSLPQSASLCHELIDTAIRYSTKKLNKVFSHLPKIDPAWNNETISFFEFVLLINDVAKQYAIDDDLRTLLSSLGINKAITAKAGSNVDKFCLHLVRGKILNKPSLARNKNSMRRYRLSPLYSAVLSSVNKEAFNP